MAIDILGGKCVRLTKVTYSTGKIYNNDPVDVALEIEDNGLKFVHVVDLMVQGKNVLLITKYLRKSHRKQTYQ